MGSSYRIDPRKQFSKRLARWTAIFWFAYMTWLSVILVIAPAAALFSVYMAIIVTVVMVVNVWAYTRNSVYEKACFAMLDKAKIEIGLTNSGTTTMSRIDDNDPDQPAEEEDVEDTEKGEG